MNTYQDFTAVLEAKNLEVFAENRDPFFPRAIASKVFYGVKYDPITEASISEVLERLVST